MRKALIDSYIAQLRSDFGPIKPPVDDDVLKAKFAEHDLFGTLGTMKRMLGIGARVFLGITDERDSDDAPAWVVMPAPFPRLGTRAYSEAIVRLYIRRAFVATASFEMIVAAFAHELSHVVLDSTENRLRRVEAAVDLTAMLLGFRDFYITGCSHFFPTREGMMECRVSYLSKEEIWYAAQAMTFR